MKNILMAWEMGGGLGHVANRMAIRGVLTQRGHRVALAFRDLRTLYRLHPALTGPVFAAPNPPGLSVQPQRAMLSFADILWHDAGLHDAAVCAGILSAWRSLLDASGCELLVADAAPMASIAANSLGIPVLRHGIAFLHPPQASPFPLFRDWEQHDASYLPQLEMQALRHINDALGHHQVAPFNTLGEACADAPYLLEGLAEMDVYGPRPTVAAIPAAHLPGHQQPQWPEGDAPRIFCYLKHDYPWLDRLIGALTRAPARCSIFIDGAVPRLPAGAPIHPHTSPIDATQAIAAADLVICSAGNGMINAALLAGKPLLLLPMQAEQYLNARRAVSLGVALAVTPPIDKPEFLLPLRRLLAEPGFAAAAQAIGKRHTQLGGADRAALSADLIEQMS